MNTLLTPASTEPELLARRRALTGILENTIASLELTDEQRKSVEKTYQDVGEHLAAALQFDRDHADIFPQGSYRLGTVIRPWREITDVFDLDLVFRLVTSSVGKDPKQYREAVGEYLRRKYGDLVKPLPKGWRLDYSKDRDYYLDIIPAMDAVRPKIIAITDGRGWRDSNPRGYSVWFEGVAKLLPRYRTLVLANEATFSNREASIEPLPEHTNFKLPLQRITQISKRHRDYHFNKKLKAPNRAPASIVITTLLTQSYERCVAARVFESGYDLLVECVRGMPDFVKITVGPNNKTTYELANPSLLDENLVAKWNEEPGLAKAFFDWQCDFVDFLELLPTERAPQRTMLEETLGKVPVGIAYQKQMEAFAFARSNAALRVVPTAGLSTTALGGLVVPNLTIHGLR